MFMLFFDAKVMYIFVICKFLQVFVQKMAFFLKIIPFRNAFVIFFV